MGWAFPAKIEALEKQWASSKTLLIQQVCELTGGVGHASWDETMILSFCRKWPAALDAAKAIGGALFIDLGIRPSRAS